MTGLEAVSGEALAAALAYAAAWRGRTVVIKVGGSLLAADAADAADSGTDAGESNDDHGRGRTPSDGGRTPSAGTAAADIALLHRAGVRAVVVHGGGPDVSLLLERLAIPATFVNGLRVTDVTTMEVVEMVLSGRVNKRLVSRLASAGAPAVGLSGRDGGLLRTRPHPETERLGLVGEPDGTDPAVLRTLLDAGYLPVVSPVGADAAGRPRNVNADAAAAAVAVGLRAEKLILLTDVAGIHVTTGDGTELRSELDEAETRHLITDGTISRGMVPKVDACLEALRGGVPSAHIVGAETPHALLVELFTEEGIGTMIRSGASEEEAASSSRDSGRRSRREPATVGTRT